MRSLALTEAVKQLDDAVSSGIISRRISNDPSCADASAGWAYDQSHRTNLSLAPGDGLATNGPRFSVRSKHESSQKTLSFHLELID